MATIRRFFGGLFPGERPIAPIDTRPSETTAVTDSSDRLSSGSALQADQATRAYGNSSVEGSATAIYGDYTLNNNVQNIHTTRIESPSLKSRSCEDLLTSLKFTGFETRERNIALGAEDTCEWIFKNGRFKYWMNDSNFSDHRGFFWLQGKPGTGKSTLMKTMIESAKTNSNTTVLTFCFHARSSNQLDKSNLGLYQTIVHQLVRSDRALEPLFREAFGSRWKQSNIVDPWTETELKNFLLQTLPKCTSSSFVIFIDALDESTNVEDQDLAPFLERLTKCAAKSEKALRICLSCRHYPCIDIDYGVVIDIKGQKGHKEDIWTYAKQNLKGFNDTSIAAIRSDLLERAQGIFLWIVLVIQLLNKHYYRRDIAAMAKTLKEVPEDLHELFGDLLTSGSEDVKQTVSLFRWILFSRMPLSPRDAFEAINLGLPKHQGLHNYTSAEDELQKRLHNCSRGLIEATREAAGSRTKRGRKACSSSTPVAQFIHQSVPDYLLGSTDFDTDRFPRSGPKKPDFRLNDFSPKKCHDFIATQCLRHLIQVSEEPTSNDQKHQLPWITLYAAAFWTRHLQEIGNECGQGLLDLAYEFFKDQKACLTWINIYHVAKRDLALFVDVPSESLGSPLSYASFTGLRALVSHILTTKPRLESMGGMLVPLKAAVSRDFTDIAELLLELSTAAEIAQVTQSSILHYTVFRRNVKIARLLLDAGADVNGPPGENWLGNQPLGLTAWSGQEEMADLLLSRGADVNHRNNDGSTPGDAARTLGKKKLACRLQAYSNLYYLAQLTPME